MGEWTVTKHTEQKGSLTALFKVEEKIPLLKINMSGVLWVLYNKRGKKRNVSFFLLLFKLVAQKQQITFTSHLLAPCT